MTGVWKRAENSGDLKTVWSILNSWLRSKLYTRSLNRSAATIDISKSGTSQGATKGVIQLIRWELYDTDRLGPFSPLHPHTWLRVLSINKFWGTVAHIHCIPGHKKRQASSDTSRTPALGEAPETGTVNSHPRRHSSALRMGIPRAQHMGMSHVRYGFLSS